MPVPSQRAMRAAVDMEMHAACSTTTKAKAEALDAIFPEYDNMLLSLKVLLELTSEMDDAGPTHAGYQSAWLIEQNRNAESIIAKAEGRA